MMMSLFGSSLDLSANLLSGVLPGFGNLSVLT